MSYINYNLSKLDNWKEARGLFDSLFKDRNDLLERVKELERGYKSLKDENENLKEKIEKCQKDFKNYQDQIDNASKSVQNYGKTFDKQIEDVRAFAQNTLSKVENMSVSSNDSITDGLQNEMIMDLSSNLEIQENCKNSNTFILKLMDNNGRRFYPEKDSKERVHQALKILDSNNASEKLKMIKHVHSIKADILKISVKEKHSNSFLNFLNANKKKEKNFKFQRFYNKVSLCKKSLLGKIMLKVNDEDENKSKMCIPRFSLEPKAIVEETDDENEKVRKPYSYKNIIRNYNRHLTEDDKLSAITMLEKFMSSEEAKIKLGL